MTLADTPCRADALTDEYRALQGITTTNLDLPESAVAPAVRAGAAVWARRPMRRSS